MRQSVQRGVCRPAVSLHLPSTIRLLRGSTKDIGSVYLDTEAPEKLQCIASALRTIPVYYVTQLDRSRRPPLFRTVVRLPPHDLEGTAVASDKTESRQAAATSLLLEFDWTDPIESLPKTVRFFTVPSRSLSAPPALPHDTGCSKVSLPNAIPSDSPSPNPVEDDPLPSSPAWNEQAARNLDLLTPSERTNQLLLEDCNQHGTPPHAGNSEPMQMDFESHADLLPSETACASRPSFGSNSRPVHFYEDRNPDPKLMERITNSVSSRPASPSLHSEPYVVQPPTVSPDVDEPNLNNAGVNHPSPVMPRTLDSRKYDHHPHPQFDHISTSYAPVSADRGPVVWLDVDRSSEQEGVQAVKPEDLLPADGTDSVIAGTPETGTRLYQSETENTVPGHRDGKERAVIRDDEDSNGYLMHATRKRTVEIMATEFTDLDLERVNTKALQLRATGRKETVAVSHKRPRTGGTERSVPLRLKFVADYQDGGACLQVMGLAQSGLHVELKVKFFSVKDAVGRSIKLSENSVAEIVPVTNGSEENTRAAMMLAAGLVIAEVQADRVHHMAQRFPASLSPRFVILNGHPVFDIVGNHEFVDVLSSHTDLVGYARKWIDKGEQERIKEESYIVV